MRDLREYECTQRGDQVLSQNAWQPLPRELWGLPVGHFKLVQSYGKTGVFRRPEEGRGGGED